MLIEETQISSAMIPIDRLKDHLRMGSGFADDSLQDTVLEGFMRASVAVIEGRIGKVLLQRNFSWTLEAWQSQNAQKLPTSPIESITALTVVDVNAASTLVPSNQYRLKRDLHTPALLGRQGGLPKIADSGYVRIEFVAGLASHFDHLPPDLAQAVLLLAAHYYQHRNEMGLEGASIPYGVSVLSERYRTLRILGGRSA